MSTAGTTIISVICLLLISWTLSTMDVYDDNFFHRDQRPKVHKCNHGNMHSLEQYQNVTSNHINYIYRSVQETQDTPSHDSHRRLLTDAETDPIRISVYYDPITITNSATLNSFQIDYIKRITSAAVRFYEEFVQVRPVDGPLSFGSDTKCGLTTVPAAHTDPGIADTDLILYVSLDDTEDNCWRPVFHDIQWEDREWAAGACKRDQYGRPYAGSINLCSSEIPETAAYARYKRDVVLMAHEIGHVLIMSRSHWERFSGYNVNAGVVPWVGSPYGDGLIYMTTPKVTEVARQHFNCSTLIGAPLEDFGHWEVKWMQSEMMTAILFDGEQGLSIFTLALMEDSGWYYVDYEWAKPFKWGLNEGCEFFTTDCINNTTHKPNFPQYYCDRLFYNGYGCSHDYTLPAICWLFDHGYNLPVQWFDDPHRGGYSSLHDYCPMRHPYYTTFNPPRDYDSLCWDLRGSHRGPGIEYAIDSRCVNTINGNGRVSGYCMIHECVDYDAVNKRWQGVNFMTSNSETIYCDRDDKLTTKSSTEFNKIRCPNVDAICGESSQPFGCFYGHYSDVHSKCICEPGYTGTLCDELNDSTDGIEAKLAPSEAPTSAEPTSSVPTSSSPTDAPSQAHHSSSPTTADPTTAQPTISEATTALSTTLKRIMNTLHNKLLSLLSN